MVYGKTLDEARDKLGKAQQQARPGIPVPDESWKLGLYLEYWLENFVKQNRRPATYNLYEMITRLYLIPGLGSQAADQPVCPDGPGCSSTSAWRQATRSARYRSCAPCSAPRSPALFGRNSSSATSPAWSNCPQWQTRHHPALVCRRGQALPRRCQARSAVRGVRPAAPLRPAARRSRSACAGRTSTSTPGRSRSASSSSASAANCSSARSRPSAGQRDLPLLDIVRQALKLQAERQAAYRADMGSAWPETGLVFTTRTGRPVEPRNFVRSFRRICEDNKIRLIKVHHLRHTVGSLLKDLHVPARDAQTILGHTRISTTLEIYTDTDEPARREALTRLHGLLDEGQN